MSRILVGLDDAANQDNANDFLMCKEAADALHSAYPGYLWAVHADGGMLNLRNMMLSPDYGYRIKVPLVYSASALKMRVIMGGGEILERFGMPRGAFNEARYSALKTNFAGDPVYDK